MNSWSLLQEQMDAEKNKNEDDDPWLDCMDGLKMNDEELMKAAVGFIGKYDDALKQLAAIERE